ncbi:MAG: DUF1150 domain-containing protein [Rhodobacteraceae bacterium]|nr:DUF1150 domain-containing protein [Paracoccaceae bacterium]
MSRHDDKFDSDIEGDELESAEDLEIEIIEDDMVMDDAALNATQVPIAYIRPLTAKEREGAPSGLRDLAVVALHDENGRPLALFPDRDTAMAAAQANDFRPVSVH